MSALVCPECNARVRPDPERAFVRCPRCDAKVRADAPRKRRSADEDEEDDRPTRSRPDRDEEVAERPRSRRRPESANEDDGPRNRRRHAGRDEDDQPISSNLGWVLGGVAACVLLVFVGGGVLAWALLSANRVAPPVAQGPPPGGVQDKQPDPVKDAPPRIGLPKDGPVKDGGGAVKDVPVVRGVEDAVWVEDAPEPLPRNEKDRPTLVLDAGGHTDTVLRTIFSPDGKRLVTIAKDKSIRFWDVPSGQPLGTLRLPIGPGDDGNLTAAALSPDGTRLAVACIPVAGLQNIMPIYLIDLQRFRVERILRGHANAVNFLDYSRDGTRLVSSSYDKTARVYDVRDGQTKAILQGHQDGLLFARFSPDGSRVLTSGYDGTARTFTLPDGKQERVMKGAERTKVANAAVRAVAWSPDGNAMASVSEDGLVRIWARDGSLSREVNLTRQHGTNITLAAVTFNKDGSEVLYGGVNGGGVVGIVNARTGEHRLKFTKHTNSVFDVTYSPDGSLAASAGGDDHDTFIWNPTDGSVSQHLRSVGRANYAVGWAEDGSHVAFGNLNRGEHDNRLMDKTFTLNEFGVGPAPKGRYLRAQTKTPRVTLKQLDFFKLQVLEQGFEPGVFRSQNPRERLYSYSMLGQDRVLVGGSFATYMLDLKQGGKMVRRFTGHSGIIFAIAPSPDGKYFVTASSDQTLCFYSPEQDKPLMSVFMAEGEWIVWTPEGYYACSANGERLMGWQINQGNEQLAQFHPAARFRRSLYNPAAMKLVLPSGGLTQALAKLGQGQGGPTDVGRVLPPQVRLVTPTAAQARRQDGKFDVQAEATSVGDRPVTAMRLLVNGRPYDGDKGVRAVPKPKLGKVKASWKIDLPPGQHLLTVVGESAVSRGLSESVSVTNATANQEAPALYVLAVGVADYPEKDMKLNFSATDAQLIVSALQKNNNGAFREVKAKILLDREATRQGVVDGLRWLSSVMTPSDVAIVFMSGHGTRDEAGNFFFITYDIDPRNMAGTCVPGEALKRALGNLPGKVIAIFDACHSGAAAERRVVGRTDDLARDLVTEDYGIVCMCSSLGSEYSLESPVTRAGFFTLGLAEGLAGRADINRDQTVHLHELEFYARLRVRQLSGGRQNPTIGRPATFQSFPMAKPR